MRGFPPSLLALALVACGSAEARAARDEPPALEGTAPPDDPALEGPALEGPALEGPALEGPALERGAEPSVEPEVAPAIIGTPGPWTEERTVESAAFAVTGAPSVIVHAPPTFDAEGPIRLVVFLHGWSGCVRQLALGSEVHCRDGDPTAREGWGLDDRFDEAEVDALFVVPQLAFLARDGAAGRFLEEGRFAAFLDETLDAIASRVGPDGLERVESITLLAHSAGFETALAVLARGGLDDRIRHLVLFDALYRGFEPFGSWADADPARRLVSITTGGRTASQSRLLERFARARMGDAVATSSSDAEPCSLGGLVRDHRVVIARTDVPHGLVPARHMAELVHALLDPQSPTGQVCSAP